MLSDISIQESKQNHALIIWVSLGNLYTCPFQHISYEQKRSLLLNSELSFVLCQFQFTSPLFSWLQAASSGHIPSAVSMVWVWSALRKYRPQGAPSPCSLPCCSPLRVDSDLSADCHAGVRRRLAQWLLCYVCSSAIAWSSLYVIWKLSQNTQHA